MGLARCCTLRAPGRESEPLAAVPGQQTSGFGLLRHLRFEKLFPRAEHQGETAEADPFLLKKCQFLYPLTSVGYPTVDCRNHSFWKVSSALFYVESDLGFWDGWFHHLLVSLESALITLLEAVSIFSENQQAASTGRICSELTTRKM